MAERLLIKFCGLTREEDVCCATRLGVWAIGIVFANSKRRVTPARALDLVAAARECGSKPTDGAATVGSRLITVGPLMVGVFADFGAQEIAEVVADVGLDAVQLHGLSGPSPSEMRAELHRVARDALVLRAIPVGLEMRDSVALRDRVMDMANGADLAILDTSTNSGFGGTGTPFCWSLARAARLPIPFLVAGGISPQNAADALRQSGAGGLDVSGGVESSPGQKDAGLMRAFVTAVDDVEGGPSR